MLPAFLTTILFSISAVCANRTAKLMGGTEANFWRLVLAGLVLALFAHTFGAGLGGASFHIFFLSGCVGFGIGDVALFQALPRLGSRLTVLIVQCLAAPFAALTEWAWLGTTLSPVEILCGLTILAGVAVAIAPGGHLNFKQGELASGIIFAIIAAYGQGFGAVISRKGYEVAAMAGQDIDGITAAYHRIIGGLIVSGLFLLAVKRKEIWQRFTGDNESLGGEMVRRRDAWRSGWHWVVINGLSGPALGVSCYQWALKTTPTGLVLPIVAITPLVVIPFTRYMEGEKPTKRSLIGGIIAVGGAMALTMLT